MRGPRRIINHDQIAVYCLMPTAKTPLMRLFVPNRNSAPKLAVPLTARTFDRDSTLQVRDEPRAAGGDQLHRGRVRRALHGLQHDPPLQVSEVRGTGGLELLLLLLLLLLLALLLLLLSLSLCLLFDFFPSGNGARLVAFARAGRLSPPTSVFVTHALRTHFTHALLLHSIHR